MPSIISSATANQIQNYISLSYEMLVQAWLTKAGFEVQILSADFGNKTDLILLNGKSHYRLQVKSFMAESEDIFIENEWSTAEIDYVICFNKLKDWGYMMPAFKESKRKLQHTGHIRFHQHPTSFIKAFQKV